MMSRQLLHLLSTGLVIFRNEDGHPLEARRLPPVIDFTEDDLVEGDEKWIHHLMTPNDIKMVQHYTNYIQTYDIIELYTMDFLYKLLAFGGSMCSSTWTWKSSRRTVPCGRGRRIQHTEGHHLCDDRHLHCDEHCHFSPVAMCEEDGYAAE